MLGSGLSSSSSSSSSSLVSSRWSLSRIASIAAPYSLPVVSLILVVLARRRYAISLAADSTRFDVQLRELFVTVFLVLLACLLLYLCPRFNGWTKFASIGAVAGYFPL